MPKIVLPHVARIVKDVKVCGEYALNDEFIKFLKENNLKDVSISQLKDVYFDS